MPHRGWRTLTVLLAAFAGPAAGQAWHRPAVIAGDGPARAALSDRDAKLDGRLRRLLTPTPLARSTGFVPARGPWERADRVRVQVRLRDEAAADALVAHGLTVERRAGRLVEGWLPTTSIADLAALDDVQAIAPARPGRLRATADVAARVNLARATGLDGSGVTVGIISDGAGALPATAVPPGCDPGTGWEGQAIAGIIGTLAPGAQVLFASGIASGLGFADAVHCLANAGARVIVDDLGFYDQPFFEDGSVAQAVRAVVQAGVSFHSAAGNDAGSHYSAVYRATPGSRYHDFATSGASDSYDEIDVAAGQELDCTLQWNDRFGAAADDYDLEVYDMGTSPPRLVVSSTNRQNGTQDPYEDLAIANRDRTTHRAGIAIKKVIGADRILDLFCFGGFTNQYVTPAGSVVGHAAVPEVVTVGAVDVSTVGLAQVEDFSSQGPVEIYFPARETRAKPDLVAFDGVDSTTPGFDPFFGTSAAAPDTAAVAALMLQRNACRTPAEIKQGLSASAIDIGAPGPDPIAGAGRLDALGAVQRVPAPTCSSNSQCDDGDPCTADICAGCSCTHTGACNDGNPCTIDTCDPATGCTFTPVEGFAGVACVCGQGLAAGTCDTAALPRVVRKRFERACKLAARAAAATSPPRARHLVRRAVALFTRARGRMFVVVRHHADAGTCVATVDGVLDDVRGIAERLRQTL